MTNIDPTARVSSNATIGAGSSIGPGCIIGDDVQIGKDTVIGPYCIIEGPTLIGDSCKFTGYASIGSPPQDLKYKGGKTKLIIGDDNTIREFVTINRGTEHGGGITSIGCHNLIMAYCHVAHDCHLGDHIVMGNVATLAGHVQVDDHVIIGGLSAVHQFTRLGQYAMIGGGSMVSLDIIPYAMASGDRARLFGVNAIGLKRNGFNADAIKKIKKAYKILFKEGLVLNDALNRLETEFSGVEEISRLVTFIRSSERGIARG
ncbi:MAG TPA: acyl-ACP--UDP-N-acetylglucosamine O-acyltransferase [Deltaproteobacteria bacterium]|nr:acyl-ACP--UDP-N-acetylglucosamine O-acyltransferase [Deltaproteobacteria bacterium]